MVLAVLPLQQQHPLIRLHFYVASLLGFPSFRLLLSAHREVTFPVVFRCRSKAKLVRKISHHYVSYLIVNIRLTKRLKTSPFGQRCVLVGHFGTFWQIWNFGRRLGRYFEWFWLFLRFSRSVLTIFGEFEQKRCKRTDQPTDRLTDRRADGRTDTPS